MYESDIASVVMNAECAVGYVFSEPSDEILSRNNFLGITSYDFSHLTCCFQNSVKENE